MTTDQTLTFDEFKEVLNMFLLALRHRNYELADELLAYARQIVDHLRRNHELVNALVDRPETLKALVADLLKLFHDISENTIRLEIAGRNPPEDRDKRIKLMWCLWPVLHRFLIQQADTDPGGDYEQKVAELYGVLAQALESPHAVALLQSCIGDVLPLPAG